MKPKKEKEQHLLVDLLSLDSLIDSANLTKKDKVLEVGAGSGIITRRLAEKTKEVISFEIDEDFKEELSSLTEEFSNIQVLYKDALDYSWSGYDKLIANLPFSLAEAVILKAIKDGLGELIIIVGENFKNELAYSDEKISIIANLFFDIDPILKLAPSSFDPQPNTSAWIVKFTAKKPNKNNIDLFLRSFILDSGKVKNALLRGFTTLGNTKRQSRELIKKLEIEDFVLEKSSKMVTGKFFLRLREKLSEILKD